MVTIHSLSPGFKNQVSGVSSKKVRSGLKLHMKLRQNGTVSFLIRLADFQARGVTHMKLHIVGTANRRVSNIEPQNVEGWNRFAQSFFIINRIHYFGIRHSLFDIRYSLFQSFFFD